MIDNSTIVAVPLAKLNIGRWGRVVRVGEGDFSRRLQEMGLTEGAECRIVRVAPLGDPFELELRGGRLCVRREEIVGFEVQPLEKG
jgi:ferrous iron transport protein A